MAPGSSTTPPRHRPPRGDEHSPGDESAFERPPPATSSVHDAGLSSEVLEQLREETVRLTTRFIDEVVIAFDLCPWASPALAAKEAEIRPILHDLRASSGTPRAALLVREELTRVPATVALVLVVLPLLEVDRLEMDALLRNVRSAPNSTDPGGSREVETSAPPATHAPSEPSFALAAFHPDAAPDLGSPARLVPFLRRSPYPLVQAVRTETLARIDRGRPSGTEAMGSHIVAEVARYRSTGKGSPLSTRDRIAVSNHAQVRAVGPAAIERVLGDIFRDRDETHRRLGIR